MLAQPSISLVLPLYNGQAFLEACLRSVFNQTWNDFELLVADDGSSDRSVEILKQVSDDRLRILSGGEHRGLFGNLNRLIGEARGPLVRIVCQDDVLEPSCLAEEIAFYRAHPSVDMTFCKLFVLDESGAIIERTALHDLPEILPPMLSAQHFFYHGCIPGNLSTVCLRRAAWKKVGGFDERLHVSGDYDLWTRLCRDRDLGVIRKHLVGIRSHRGQLSAKKSSGVYFIEENRRIRESLRPRLPSMVRAKADRFERWRHDVLDFHYALRAGLSGRFRDVWRLTRGMGWLRSAQAFAHWLLTANNRRRPQAPWVMPEESFTKVRPTFVKHSQK